MDEVLTPDSSRYWPADSLPGRQQPTQLRQAVSARLAGHRHHRRRALGQNRPGPHLPKDVITKTAAKYQEALTRPVG